MRLAVASLVLAAAALLAACGGGGSAAGGTIAVPAASPSTGSVSISFTPSSAPSSSPLPAPPAANAAFRLPAGFTASVIANVPGARELAAAPNGDLFVGTNGTNVYLVANADGPGVAATPVPFAQIQDAPAAGVALGASGVLYVGGQFNVYRVTYQPGQPGVQSITKIASERPGGSSDHATTSVAFDGTSLWASVGSSCDACTETDPTRATIQKMGPNGDNLTTKAVRIRNAIALAINPATGTLWAGVAGQDALPPGRPYEIFDAVSIRPGTVDYGWPVCYENRVPAQSGVDCSNVAIPRVVFPAYETPIGAVFAPLALNGAYHFPGSYAGGAFVALHGSWHTPHVAPRVDFVSMNADAPAQAVNWSDPTTQWSEFLGGLMDASGNYLARPTGITFGPQGSLFVADDQNGVVYRIRPS